MRLLLALLALGTFAVPASAQAEPAPDFRVDIASDGTSTIVEGGNVLRHVRSESGERYEWNLDPSRDYTIGEIHVRGAFEATRAQQVMPLWQNRTGARDEHYFTEVRFRDFEASHLVNYTGPVGDLVIRLGLEGPDPKTILLILDVRAPGFFVGEAQNLRSNRGGASFLVETRTDEYAYADLQIHKASGGDWIPNPTTIPTLFQTFPVQGLRDNTTYEWRVYFRDWSGNQAASDSYFVDTPASPGVARPFVRILEPTAGATLGTARPTVRATIDSAGSPVSTDSIHVLLDKRVVTGFTISGQNLTYVPPDLGSGPHAIAVEATNDVGGMGRAEILFTISLGVPSLGPALVLLALALAALRR